MGITQQPEGKVNKTNMYLLVHTGSRGLGASILRHYTKSDANPYFPPGHEEYEGYLEKHNHAVKWAQANRDLVAWRIRECLFGRNIVDDGDEVISVNDEEEEDDDRNEVESETGAKPYNNTSEDPREELNKILDVTHNSVVRCGYQITPDSGSTDVWVHRKGAAPSDRGFVPCPGSRGAFSWVLQPSGNGQSNGSFLSSLYFSLYLVNRN
jgi:release factor H-coupled RctB family protein